MGFNIDRDGLSKTTERVDCVLKTPIPKDVSQLRAFVGMVNYYSKFIPNYANIMAPLYALLKKENQFLWTKTCQNAYEAIKKEVTSDQILVHFNPELPIVLETDASKVAVAGILSHRMRNGEMRPIAFVSRSLSPSELNYSVIEKEALAIIYSVIKLRQYLMGIHFELHTDHKPLLAIFGEHRGLPVMASARMQRWAFILSGFDYHVKHIKGVANHADSLTRMPLSPLSEEINYVENNYVNYADYDNVLQLDFRKIAMETRRDPILSKLSAAILAGTVKDLSGDQFEPFRSRDLELNVESDCILWGYRTIIPNKFRNLILQSLHASHLGIVKTKALARSYVWWPKMDSDIEQMIKGCDSCKKLLPNPEKSPLIQWNPTDSVWSRVHIDFAGPINGFQFLIVVDSHSKWVEIFKTKTATSDFVIGRLREIFCRFGLVNTLVSDNGSQFTSEEFKHFVQANGVNHVLTAPGHPATNGQAENFVKTFKKSILASLNENKSGELDTILNRFLADYRSSKHCVTNESPYKVMFGREMRTRFTLLKPPLVKERIIESQAKSINNFKGNREVVFDRGDNVLIRDYSNPNKATWSKATIERVIGPRSYGCIISRNNRYIKRHVDQLRSDLNEQRSAGVGSGGDIGATVSEDVTKAPESSTGSTNGTPGQVSVSEESTKEESTPRLGLRPKKIINYKE